MAKTLNLIAAGQGPELVAAQEADQAPDRVVVQVPQADVGPIVVTSFIKDPMEGAITSIAMGIKLM